MQKGSTSKKEKQILVNNAKRKTTPYYPGSNTLFAHDFSGSTHSCSEYHQIAQRIFRRLKYRTNILLWGDSYEFVDERQYEQIGQRKAGNGRTEPINIVQACIQMNFKGHLIIVTDGQVDDVDEVDLLIKNSGLTFERVTIHIISSNPNVSVGVPFTRNCPHEVYLHNDGGYSEQIYKVIRQDLEVLSYIDVVQNQMLFIQIFDMMSKVVQAATIGTTNPQIRDKLLAMKKRVIANKALYGNQGSNHLNNQKYYNLVDIKDGKLDTAFFKMKDMYDDYYSDNQLDFEAKVSYLVNMCEGHLRSVFDLKVILSQRAATATQSSVHLVEYLPEEQVVMKLDNCRYLLECPITFDETQVVILLVKSPDLPLLGYLEKNAVEDVINNPLNAFKYKEFIQMIADHLDVFVSLESYQQAEKAKCPMKQSPITRQPICGVISFGQTEEHSSISDDTLRKLLSNGKQLGNINLWFAVIYFIIKGDPKFDPSLIPKGPELIIQPNQVLKKPHSKLERLTNLVPFFEHQLKWRLENRTTFASLTGLSQFVCTRIPLGSAIWHIIHSCFLKLESNVDPMRIHIYHISRFLDLLDIVGYRVDIKALQHVSQLLAMMSLLQCTKKPKPGPTCSSHQALNLYIKALRQKVVVFDYSKMNRKYLKIEHPVPVVMLDGPASAAQIKEVMRILPNAVRHLPVSVIFGLFQMVHPNKSASDIHLDFDWEAPELDDIITSWEQSKQPLDLQLAQSTIIVPICLATCRPYAEINQKSWRDAASAAYEDLPYVNGTKYFGMFVNKFNFYPSEQELLSFIWNRQSGKSLPVQTLPTTILEEVQTELKNHEQIIKEIDPKEFVKRWKESCSVLNRIKMEKEEDKK
ncbi:Conserved_hypothetical protein [Hexamita inflata]|uniref:Uncharacterized protein n=1 Tax=Hexamita inflata TaxID=28002 RepID=A0AA86NQA8_9EUKA|nr:Conserved hypothetical protein [Hexamita inflata]